MTAINRWILSVLDIGPDIEHSQYRVVNIWYNQNYTVFGVNPNPGGQAPADNNVVTLHDLGNGTIALQCGGGYNAFASMRNDYEYQVQFQAPYSAGWIAGIGGDETLQVIPTGDGYFALYSPTFHRYVTVDSGPDTAASNCYPLRGTTADIRQATRFTAAGQDHLAVLDFVRIGKNASGLSFAGANLSNVDLSGGNDLTGCDFRRVAQGSLGGCVLDGAKLQYASFAGLRLDGLSISNADCTHADFTGCDFTSFVPRTPPPVLADADLSGAVIPEGNSWSGADLADAVLAEATLTGCDLSGEATNLTRANLSGVGVMLFGPGYQGGGIGGYDLLSPADRVIAFDYDGTPGQTRQNYLVCYRPGTGIIFIVRKNSERTFDPVYQSGVPANGIGGYNLLSPADRIIAYDCNSTGNLDHLVCYRPGTGIIFIIQKKSDGTFDPVYQSGVPPQGIGGSGGCDLSDPNDRIIAFDYCGTGHLDHLVCYRVGTGNIWILEKDTDQNNKVTFTRSSPQPAGSAATSSAASPTGSSPLTATAPQGSPNRTTLSATGPAEARSLSSGKRAMERSNPSTRRVIPQRHRRLHAGRSQRPGLRLRL
jgi:Pentapeptide repeats (8 copies)